MSVLSHHIKTREKNINRFMDDLLMNNLEEIWKRSNFEKRRNWKFEEKQEKISKRNLFQKQKSTVFPKVDIWNGLKEEIIMAKNIHQLKEKLDNTNVTQVLYITTR